MNRDQKAATIKQLATEFNEVDAVFALDYRGITVSQIAGLRSKLLEAQTDFRVVKNSLAERAADEVKLETLKPVFEGPTALALIRGDTALAAKTIRDFAREYELLDYKGGLMDGEAVDVDQFKTIATLPSREVLYGRLVGTVASPLNGLAQGLNNLISGIAVQLQQIHDQGLIGNETKE